SAAPMVLNTRALARALPDNIDYVLGRRTPPIVTPATSDEDRSFSQQFSFSLDLWWLYLFYMHVLPRGAIFALGATGVVVTAVMTLQIRRALSQSLRAAGP